MNINIQTESKRQNLLEKINIKKFLSNPRAKFLLSSIGTSTGITGTIALLKYLTENKRILPTKERIINGVKLSVADQIWVLNNFFLCEWENNSCWHDVFLQYLMLPEIICNNYNSKKIMKMIKWIRKKNASFNNDRFSCGVKVDPEARQVNDSYEKFISGTQKNFSYMLCAPYNTRLLTQYGVLGANTTAPQITVESNDDTVACAKHKINKTLFLGYKEYLKENESFGLYIENYENEGYRNQFEKEYGKEYFRDIERCKKLLENPKLEHFNVHFITIDDSIINSAVEKNYKYFFENGDVDFLREYNYRPTFIVVHDPINWPSVPHYYGYYVVYDKNEEIKYFLLADGIKSGLKPMKKSDVLNDLKQNKYDAIDVHYSSNDIVRKYYIPERQS